MKLTTQAEVDKMAQGSSNFKLVCEECHQVAPRLMILGDEDEQVQLCVMCLYNAYSTLRHAEHGECFDENNQHVPCP